MLDLATCLGLLFGALVIGAALLLAGIGVDLLWQPEALLVVFGGTLTALLLQYSFASLFAAFGAIKHALAKETLSTESITSYIFDAAHFIREQGFLALEPLLADIEIPFLQDGFRLLIDNTTEGELCRHLNTKMDVAYEAEMTHVKIYESAAGFAPTMGILGAVIGLVKTLGTFGSDTEALGHGVAGAFMATLLGVGLANLFLLPVAGKLAEKARQTRYLKSIMLLGLVSLQRGENPNRVRDQLSAFEMNSARWDEVLVPQHAWEDVQTAYPESTSSGIQEALWGNGGTRL